MKDKDLIERLQLEKFRTGFWKIQQTCGLSGEGLYEGLNWLVNCFRSPPQEWPI